jgi:glycosyltransferase involved in cell wall biosynthesis
MPERISCSLDVITICRNDLSGLRRTAQSVEQQSENNLSWIIVDGNSTDGTRDWLQSHKFAQPTIWSSEKDSGIYNAMNKGVSYGSGALLSFMNSGDTFACHDSASTLTNKYIETGMCWGYGMAAITDQIGSPQAVHHMHPYRRLLWELGLRSIPHQAAYIERRLFAELGGFNEEIGLAADQDLLFRASLQEAPAVIWAVIAHRSAGGASWGRAPYEFPRDMFLSRQRAAFGGTRRSWAKLSVGVTSAYVQAVVARIPLLLHKWQDRR